VKAALALTVALGTVTAPALCCPCSDDSGSASSLVRDDERYAVAVVAASRRALGRFDAFGHYSALGAREHEASEELLLRAGFRLPPRWEWLGELGYSDYRFHAPFASEHQSGIGDAQLHTRYRVWEESMPHVAWPLPALSLSALVRAPLGALATQQGGSFGSGGAERGLGTWEAGAGVELMRSVLPTLFITLGSEAAYRFEDHVLDEPRRLGPRLDTALGLRAMVAPWLSTNAAVRFRVTGDVELAGRTLDGTGERLWSLITGVAVFERASRFRSALTLSVDPPLSGISAGSTAAVSLAASVGIGVE